MLTRFMLRSIIVAVVTVALAILMLGGSGVSQAAQPEGGVDSDNLATFAAVIQYIRSQPTPADVKADNISFLSALDTVLSDAYITDFITPYTGEISDQVKSRLQSIAEEDRFIAVMVESYRLSPNPLPLDLIHQLLSLYYVEFFTTAADLNASKEFLKRDDIESLAAAFDPADYAIPAPPPPSTPGSSSKRPSPSTRPRAWMPPSLTTTAPRA